MIFFQPELTVEWFPKLFKQGKPFYGSWIYKYLCNQCLSPLMSWVRLLFCRGVFDTTLCYKVSVTCDRSVVFSGYTGFLHDITEILLKVVLNTTATPPFRTIKGAEQARRGRRHINLPATFQFFLPLLQNLLTPLITPLMRSLHVNQ
jgi:hypothetical protein